MIIAAVSQQDFHEATALLQKAFLPVEDIKDNVQLFVMKEGNKIVGTIGIEHNHRFALLRSLSVDEKERGKGYGDALVKFLEGTAKEKGIQTIYLLTTTAASFFSKKGYAAINRSDVPDFIQHTSEFYSVCPSTATGMKKQLP